MLKMWVLKVALDYPYLALARFVIDLVKYGAASFAALAVDFSVLFVLNEWAGVHYQYASTVGFLSGLIVIYSLSINYVYRNRRKVRPLQEFILFLGIGLAGLALNQLLMYGFVELVEFTVPLAKSATAGFVFMFNFLVRRSALFSAHAPSVASSPRSSDFSDEKQRLDLDPVRVSTP